MRKLEVRSWKLEEFKILLLFSFIFISNITFGQYKIPEKPSLQTSVYDYAKLLSDSEKTQLEEKLVRYSDTTSTQIVMITIDDLKGEDVGVLATNWAQTWGIGQAKEDNGVIILVSKNDRKVSIRPGYGVEDRLVAGICGQIIRNDITPEFKAGSYYNGLNKGAESIFKVLTGKYKGERKQDKKEGSILPILLVIGFVIIFLILVSKNKGNNGGNNGGFGGPDLMDIIILSSMGRGGGGSFGGGSSSGGGFGGGFGGGGFSGGGASGNW